MNKVTTAQQRKIHALARELGMVDDLLHEYVSMLTEKQSLKDLTVMEAVKVIDAMEGKKGYAAGDRISWRQERYIECLMAQLEWVLEDGKPDKKRLDGFVKKQYGLDDSRWMTRKTASRVIEGLKALAARKRSETSK